MKGKKDLKVKKKILKSIYIFLIILLLILIYKPIKKQIFIHNLKKSVSGIWFMGNHKKLDEIAYLLDYSKDKELSKALKKNYSDVDSEFKDQKYYISDNFDDKLYIEGYGNKKGINIIYNRRTNECDVLETFDVLQVLILAKGNKVIGIKKDTSDLIMYDLETKKISIIEKNSDILEEDAKIRINKHGNLIYQVLKLHNGESTKEQILYTRYGEKLKLIEENGRHKAWDINENKFSNKYNYSDFEVFYSDNEYFIDNYTTSDGKYEIVRYKEIEPSKIKESNKMYLKIRATDLDTGKSFVIFRGDTIDYGTNKEDMITEVELFVRPFLVF